MKKTLVVFTGIFIVQFLYSCDFYGNGGCGCSSIRDYHMNLVGLDLLTIHFNEEQGFEQIPDSVSRSEDNFSIELAYIPDFVADPNATSFSRRVGGFSSAYACDCVGSYYYLVDKIASVQISVLDVSSNTVSDVSSLFTYNDWYSYSYDYGDPLPDVDFSAIDHFYEARAIMYLSLIELSEMPSESVFRITVEMESGNVLNQETDVIRFY